MNMEGARTTGATSAGHGATILVFVAIVCLLAPTAPTAGQPQPQEQQQQCTTYEAELQSRPDFTHKTVYQASILPPNYLIQSVSMDSKRPRSFYWCELKVLDMDGHMQVRRRFGHNGTHWWVEKGCGGWFFITGCPPGTVYVARTTAPSQPAPAESNTDGLPDKQQAVSGKGSALNGKALQSLINWITEESQNKVTELLGANSRVV